MRQVVGTLNGFLFLGAYLATFWAYILQLTDYEGLGDPTTAPIDPDVVVVVLLFSIFGCILGVMALGITLVNKKHLSKTATNIYLVASLIPLLLCAYRFVRVLPLYTY